MTDHFIRRAKISNIEKEILRLATQLDVTLGRPPSSEARETPLGNS